MNLAPKSVVRTQRYFDWLYRNRLALNISILIFTVFSVVLASRLQLKTNFSELLPDKLPSVQSFRKVVDRLGGTGTLLIGVESPDYQANRKFVEALAAKIQPLVGKSLRYFEYRYEDVEDFIGKYGLQYLTLPQLKKFKDHLEEEIETHKDEAIGLGLTTENEKKDVKASGSDWVNEMDSRMRIFLRYKDAYLSAEDGKIMVLSLRPLGSSLGVEQSVLLANQIQGFINELNPKSFHPQMTAGLGGNVASAIAEYDTIRHDIIDTALLLVGLIVVVLLLFFWSVRVLLLLFINLIFPVAWTFALTYLHIGYLNTQTAFLGSLVVGTGINYGIMFISRYIELRRSNKPIEEAIVIAISATAIPTLIASATTSASFLSLLIADNKGFSQFGFIGFVGIVFCWIAAFTLLPLWLYSLEHRFPVQNWNNPLGQLLFAPTVRLGNFFIKHAAAISLLLVGISVIGAMGFYKLYKDPVEYNFDNLRNKVAKTSGTEAIERRINKVFSGSMTPSIVLMSELEQAKELCPRVMQIAEGIPLETRIIESCATIYEILPKPLLEPEGRRAMMQQIQETMKDSLLRFSSDWPRIKKFRDNFTFEIPSINEIPPQLARRFTERDGKVGLIGFVSPDSNKPLNDGRNLLAFTDSLANIDLPKGDKLSATGDSFILADLLREIKVDGPRVALIAFFASTFIAMFLSGGISSGILMAFCLAVATWWMLCIQGTFGLKYNFFNFIALPLTFGIGIDYPINVFVRCTQESFRNYGNILATSGCAVLLCSLTTIIGYYTLIDASNLALVSFAKLAIIGEFTCIAAALVVLPVLLRLRGRFKEQ